MPAAPQTTLLEVVNLVAQSVGHPTTNDVASSPDEAIKRMAFYANAAGMELLTEDWQVLNKEDEISIFADTPGQSEKAFDLPADFQQFVDDTQWDRSTQLPAIGPVNSQDWQWLVVRDAMITTRFMWRIRLGKLYIKSPPDTPTPFSFEYQSKLWARDADNDDPKEIMVKNGDYHVYPWYLVVLLTRAKWLDNEGFDASKAYRAYKDQLGHELGGDRGATALSLVPGVGYPYLNAMRNAPDTGYGS